VRRRAFITLLGGAAAAWPLAVRAEQMQMRRIGVLMPSAADDPVGQIRLGAFLEGLQPLGWAVGSNVQIDIRWTAGDAGLSRKYAAELVGLAPHVILAAGGSTVEPLLQVARQCRAPKGRRGFD
jgi:putative tryptophan/tyrosine transport system substrate-binding protein